MSAESQALYGLSRTSTVLGQPLLTIWADTVCLYFDQTKYCGKFEAWTSIFKGFCFALVGSGYIVSKLKTCQFRLRVTLHGFCLDLRIYVSLL
jgi:hypothetical protein